MQFDVMTQLIESEFDNIRNVRETKGREYAGEEDTLADFKEVATEAGITPLQCWLTYVKKHQRAVDTFIREGSVKSEAIEDRIRDIVVYHLLLLGLIEDLRAPSPHERMGPQCTCHRTDASVCPVHSPMEREGRGG
jgi:hypothetical protein